MGTRPELQFSRTAQDATFDAKFVDGPDGVDDAQQRRRDDAHMAARLVAAGIPEEEVYVVSRGITDTAVANDLTGWTEDLGRPLRRWFGFSHQAFAAKCERGIVYTAFADEHEISEVRQIRVCGPIRRVALEAFRDVHKNVSKSLIGRLRHGISHHAPGIKLDVIAAHIIKDGDGFAYLHFHIVSRGGTPDELAALRRYWIGENRKTASGWDWWDSEIDEGLEEFRHPVALVQYIAGGLATALDDDWTEEELAELWRQTRGLSMVRAVGEFRRWVGKLKADQKVVCRDEEGHTVIETRKPSNRLRRFREKLFQDVGFTLLRHIRHDFGDGCRRSAWLVRGRPGVTLADISASYDLAGSQDHTFTTMTAMSESLNDVSSVNGRNPKTQKHRERPPDRLHPT